jgi:hypothetical protein
MTKHVVNLSGGACSFWAAHRVAERYGTADMVLLFADVLIEDPELYEFNDWTAGYFGVSVTRVSRELTPWQLFRQKGVIGHDRLPICSIMLKREPLWEWHAENLNPRNSLFGEPDMIYVGLDWNESHRLEILRANQPEWVIEAPMCEWEPVWDKCTMLKELKALGAPEQRSYREGFPHNNCGRRCVRAGISHFVKLFKTDAPAFLEWEREEAATIAELTTRGTSSADFTLLTDRRGGIRKSMTLAQLRERIEAGDKTLPKYDWGGCGCGVETPEQVQRHSP